MKLIKKYYLIATVLTLSGIIAPILGAAKSNVETKNDHFESPGEVFKPKWKIETQPKKAKSSGSISIIENKMLHLKELIALLPDATLDDKPQVITLQNPDQVMNEILLAFNTSRI